MVLCGNAYTYTKSETYENVLMQKQYSLSPPFRVINYKDIQLGKQIGIGSYGLVFHGKWKGIDVAVKRFIKQNLTERSLLEFRAEMAILSELHHPNIVLFVGSVTRFMLPIHLNTLIGPNSGRFQVLA